MKIAHTRGWMRAVVSAALLATGALAQRSGEFEESLPARNPCATLTSFEATTAFGVAVEPGAIVFRNRATVGCSFVRPAGERVGLVILRVASADWLAEQADRMRRGSTLGSYLEVETIGERAFLLGTQSARPVLCVFKSPYYLQISVSARALANGKPNRAALEMLARAALSRLTPGAELRPDRGPDLRSRIAGRHSRSRAKTIDGRAANRPPESVSAAVR